MTELDKALIWAFEDDATRWVDSCPELAYEEEREAAARGYRAGQAASAERIKALEEAIRRLLAASEPVETYTHEVAVRLEEAVEHAEALLKEADQ